ILQLGDSIAAGEGTRYGYSYNPANGLWSSPAQSTAQWAGPYPICHDSPDSYGNVVADALGTNFFNFACTDATYLNGITAAEHDGSTPYRPAEFSGNAEYDQAAPDVVLATFGADDIQFVDVVTACIVSHLANSAGNAVLHFPKSVWTV